MDGYVITACSTADLPKVYAQKHNLYLLPYSFMLGNDEYKDNFGISMPFPVFYERVRGGQMPSTSMVNASSYEEVFSSHLEKGQSVLHIEFSSALSGSYGNALSVAEKLNAKFESKVYVVDSLCASLGNGLLVDYALKMKENGVPLEEVHAWVEEHKLKVIHWFTVDDLNHLKRGGRVSGASAFIGTMLKIKPVLNVDDMGRLIPCFKVRGRKKAIVELVNRMKIDIQNPEGQTVFISHGDCEDEAKHLAKLVKEAFPSIGEIMLHYVGPVIGAHSGPGTIALFYMGKNRYHAK